MPPPPSGGKVTPNLAVDTEATRMLNLTVLQRLDPAVEDILVTAAHVTLYGFNIDLNQWVSAPPFSLYRASAIHPI
jgi:mRNA-decapping enzyme 1B